LPEADDERALPGDAPLEGGALLAEVMAIVEKALREKGLLREPASEASSVQDAPARP
jgi:hypothetical protein